jgi:tripartite-type tricarboxylate transporter receptor subunit TctC
VVFYQTMFRQLLDTPDMTKFIADGGFDKALLVGSDFARWLETKSGQVRDLMVKAGWVK